MHTVQHTVQHKTRLLTNTRTRSQPHTPKKKKLTDIVEATHELHQTVKPHTKARVRHSAEAPQV